jgi:tetratricopeptide (TPR) repeat protein
VSQLENLLQLCTVKLTLPDRTGWGTGFFVAPGWILTCAHVVQEAKGQPVQVRWQTQENWATALVERTLSDFYDLALLRVTLPVGANPPCVYLGEEIRSRDPLYLFGYPDEGDFNGEPRTFNCDGITGSETPSILFNLGQVRPGMSGSPLLNQETGKVCGMVKFTRDRSTDLGGGAIPTSVILAQFPDLAEQQRSFHQRDQRWNTLVTQPSNDPPVSQPSLGGKKILMLLANPESPKTPRKKEETRKIRDALKRAKNGNLFELLERPDISADDLSQELSTIEPYIIDIFGCDNGIEGLVLEESSEKNTLTDLKKIELIAELFQLHSKRIECIILNRCYSEEQAREIVQHVEFVIGISQNLENTKTAKFLSEFYYHLGSEHPIRNAYKLGCNSVERTGLQDICLLPILLNRDDERNRRSLEEKLSSCNKGIETNQNDVELWQKKANLLKELGRSEEADEAYERASLLAPNNYKIRTEQGDALEQVGKYEKAASIYDKALELEEKDYKVWWKKGQALVEAKKHGEAVGSYDKAVALSPPSPDNYVIYREYGSILKKLGQYQESIILYKKSLGLEPRYRASNYEKRRVYKKMRSGEV